MIILFLFTIVFSQTPNSDSTKDLDLTGKIVPADVKLYIKNIKSKDEFSKTLGGVCKIITEIKDIMLKDDKIPKEKKDLLKYQFNNYIEIANKSYLSRKESDYEKVKEWTTIFRNISPKDNFYAIYSQNFSDVCIAELNKVKP
jgi:hypothetical protein